MCEHRAPPDQRSRLAAWIRHYAFDRKLDHSTASEDLTVGQQETPSFDLGNAGPRAATPRQPGV